MKRRHRTIRGLCDRYIEWAMGYFRCPITGRATGTIGNIRDATGAFCSTTHPERPSCTVGDAIAANTTARMLYAMQQRLASQGLHRRTINDRVQAIQRMYRWAASPGIEFVPEDVGIRLGLIQPLKFGRSRAKESDGVPPVTYEQVAETAAHAGEPLRTMLWLHWHTGMRPGEVCGMRLSWIDRDHEPWVYQPREHKTAYLRKPRIIPLGPRAREVLEGYIAKLDGDLLFPGRDCRRIPKNRTFRSPRSNAEKRAEVAELVLAEPHLSMKAVARELRVSFWLVRDVRRKLGLPPAGEIKLTGEPMAVRSYYRAVRRIQQRHGLDRWTPAQIRHGYATRVERAIDIDAARLLLDHGSAKTTNIYVEPDVQRKILLAQQIG